MLHPSHMVSLLPSINWPTLVKFVRMCGGDMMMGPTIWSSMPVTSLEEAMRTAQVAQAPMHGLKKMWAMPSAGVHPGLVDILVDEYGTDMIVPTGGGMLGHPLGYTAGAKAMQQAIDAKMDGISREEGSPSIPRAKGSLRLLGHPHSTKNRAGCIAPRYFNRKRSASRINFYELDGAGYRHNGYEGCCLFD